MTDGPQQRTRHDSRRYAASVRHRRSKARDRGQMRRSTSFGPREACKMGVCFVSQRDDKCFVDKAIAEDEHRAR